MTVRRRARAGLYAQERYLRGLRAYRRRLRTPLLIVVVPMYVFVIAVMLTRHLDRWTFAAGVVGSAATALIVFVRDDPPGHVVHWRRGAEGERKTEKALRPLERKGWRVEHDIQREGAANLDHVVTGPPGVFLLETKSLAGTIAFENGVLVARQFDDPDEVYRYTSLAPRLRGQAKELSSRLREETGRGAWVTAVAVIWGHFPADVVEHENVVYIRGDKLVEWLLSNQKPASPAAPSEST
jgi:hypothetical protein